MDGQKLIPDEIIVLEDLEKCGHSHTEGLIALHISHLTKTAYDSERFHNLINKMKKDGLIDVIGSDYYDHETLYGPTPSGLKQLQHYRKKVKVNT